MIKPGEEWERPLTGETAIAVDGTDRDLAEAVTTHRGALIRFRPSPESDLAGVVGLARAVPPGTGPTTGREVALDALVASDGTLAVNMIVAGVAPDRVRRFVRRIVVAVDVDGRRVFSGPATTIVVATGQFLRGLDVVPRGHPGDGRAEVQIYAVPPGQRAAMRGRLATGTHVPHSGITQRAGRRIVISANRPFPVETDGRAGPAVRALSVDVAEGAYRLVV